MERSLERKSHDSSNFIDHTLLDNALMGTDWDVVDNSTALPSTSGAHDAHTHYATDKDAMPANLTFHNSYFQFVNKHVVPSNQHHVLEHAPGPPGVVSADAVLLADEAPGYVPEKHVATADFLNLNSSFLDGTPEVVGDGGVHGHNAPAVPVHAIEPTVPIHQSTLHEDDLLYAPNLRKVLPHKKRISRKLKGTLGDYETVAGDVVTAAPIVDASSTVGYPDDMVVVDAHNKRLIYTCELCGFAASTQIDFFAHLKQHYEPMNSVVAPTLLDDPMKNAYHRTLDDTVSKNCDNLCNVMDHTKLVHTTRDADEQAKLHQVLRAVELDFEHFHHHQPVTHDVTEVVVINANGGLNHHVTLAGNQQINGDPETTDHSHACYVTPVDELTLNNVNVAPANNVVDDVEFSDTEDMLEGMRNVVDKVSFEDTCDELDLITSNDLRSNWFGTNNFSDINYRNCDESFSGQLSQLLLVAEPQEEQQVTQSHSHSIPATTTTEHLVSMKSMVVESPTTQTLLDSLSNHQPHHALPFLITNSTTILPEHLHSVTNEQIHIEHELANNKLDSNKILTTLTVLQPIDPQQSIVYSETPQPQPSHQQISIETPTLTTLKSSSPLTELPISQSSDSTEDQRGNQTATTNTPTTTTTTTTEDDTIQDTIPSKPTKTRNRKAKAKDEPSSVVERSDKKTFWCSKCEREFNSRNALKYHSRTHTQDRPHTCDECGRSFFAIGALKMHVRTHTGEKPFECSICQRKFGRFGDLKYHCESIHNDVKAHMCEYCGKSFSRKYSLVLHRKIHTCERNFNCDYCSKSFRASCYLKSHMKIHTGEKPYPCTVCDKKFRVLGDMRRHMRIHERANTAKSTLLEAAESGESDKEDEETNQNEHEAEVLDDYAAIEKKTGQEFINL